MYLSAWASYLLENRQTCMLFFFFFLDAYACQAGTLTIMYLLVSTKHKASFAGILDKLKLWSDDGVEWKVEGITNIFTMNSENITSSKRKPPWLKNEANTE